MNIHGTRAVEGGVITGDHSECWLFWGLWGTVLFKGDLVWEQGSRPQRKP